MLHLEGPVVIVKELDAFAPTADAFANAGRAAEEQMAFYLRRAFAKEERLQVFNGIRLEVDGDAAQIDHLILHRWGFLLIESKSVSSRIGVNSHGEWIRWSSGQCRGMPSPLLQAYRQADFLRDYLQEHVTPLRDRAFFRRRDFSGVALAVLIAISDRGIIDRPRGIRLDEVCKADQVADMIKDDLRAYQTTSTTFSKGEVERISAFLIDHHKPRPDDIPGSTAPMVRMPRSQQASSFRPRGRGKPSVCRHCHGGDLTVLYGRYGHYYKCRRCDGNTHIDTTCPRCGAEETIRQNGRYYLADCQWCATSTAFYPPHAVEPVSISEGRRGAG